MKRPESPCANCKDRQVGCHALCKAYADFKAATDDYKEQVCTAIGGSKRITYNKRRQVKVWGIR